jgi:hypothetical protein
VVCEPSRSNRIVRGSDGGDEQRAVIASVIETWKLYGVDPCACLAATITKIVNGHPNARLDEPPARACLTATALRDVA